MKGNLRNKGITLIALIITVIVLLIIAGITISTLTGDHGILTQTKIAAMQQELTVLEEEYSLFCAEKTIETMGEFSKDTVTAATDALIYNGKEEKGQTIYNVMPSLKNSRYRERTEIINGIIYIDTTDPKEAEIIGGYGIIANPFKIEDGVLKSNEDNLALLGEDGVLNIPASVKKIDAGAFSNLKLSNKNIKKVIIPGTVKEIGANAFSNNETLEEVVIEDGVEIIGTSAFLGCKNLKTVTMTDSVVEIGQQAFYKDSNLESIRLSNNIKKLNGWIFSACTSLAEIKLPQELNVIEGDAFANTPITKINIPKNVSSISSIAFFGCTRLETIEIDANNANFASEKGILFNKDKTQMIWVSQTAIAGDTFTVPSTVTTLMRGLIDNYSNINKVIIPKSTTKIEPLFFTSKITDVEIDSENPNYLVYQGGIYNKDKTILYKYVANDAVVTLPEGLNKIERYAFYGKGSTLTSVLLPDSLKSIGDQAFSGCSKLKELTLGDKIETLTPLFIYSLHDIRLTIDGNNPNYQIIDNAILDIRNENEKVLLTMIGNPVSYTIPNGVTKIENYAFHSKSKLEQVIIPNTVKKIENSFNFCTKLTTINIPTSVESINKNCFNNCSNLQEIRIDKPENSITGAPWGATLGGRVKVIWNE